VALVGADQAADRPGRRCGQEQRRDREEQRQLQQREPAAVAGVDGGDRAECHVVAEA